MTNDKAAERPTTIPKTTDQEGTGDNEANLGQPVADASGDQSTDPNEPQSTYTGSEPETPDAYGAQFGKDKDNRGQSKKAEHK